MIKTENLTKRYGNHLALDNLNIEIKQGEIYALLGSNGAGKSTTINIFLGFMGASSGKAFIDNIEVSTDNSATRQLVAYIPEIVSLYPTLTGMENLEFFSGLSGYKYTTNELQVYMEQAGLQREAFHKRISSYSKGMRQKVGIAIALVKKAKALFLDEPTSGLDPQASNEFSEVLAGLSKKGVSILMATHDLFIAKETGHRIGIMHKGKLENELIASEISHTDLNRVYLNLVNN